MDSSSPASDATPSDPWASLGLHFVSGNYGGSWPLELELAPEWFDYVVVDLTCWFFYKGSGLLTDLETGTTYALRPGVFLLLQPGMKLRAAQVGDDQVANIYYHIDLLREGRKLPVGEWPPMPLYTEVSHFDFFNHTAQRIVTLLQHREGGRDGGRREALLTAEYLFKGLVHDACQLSRQPGRNSTLSHHEQTLQTALRALEEEPRRFRSVEAWAASTGYSPGHFRALSLKLTGQTPMQHLVRVRMSQARRYLRDSTQTVSAIADLLGYENTHYFSRQFRRETGMTASEYRDRRRAVIRSAEPPSAGGGAGSRPADDQGSGDPRGRS